MAARGPYAKGKAKRAEILDTALRVIAEQGYSGATVKQLADAVGLSQNGLLHYFGSKDNLFLEILKHRDQTTEIETDYEHRDIAGELVQGILDAVDAEISAPGMTQLSLRMSGEATEPGHLAHDYYRERYDQIRTLVEEALTRRMQDGDLPADVDPAAVATLIWAAWDGLQLQWMYDRTIDVKAQLVHLLHALGVTPARTSESVHSSAAPASLEPRA